MLKIATIALIIAGSLTAQVAHPRIWLDSDRIAQLKAQIATSHYGGTAVTDSAEFTALLAAANTQIAQPIAPYDHAAAPGGTLHYDYRGDGWAAGILPVALAYAATGNTTYSTYVISFLNMLADTGRILTLTSVTGVNVGDIVTGPNIPVGTTVLAIYPVGNAYNTKPQVLLSNWFTANIAGSSTIVFNGSNSLTTPAAGTSYANLWNGDPEHDTNSYASRNVPVALAIAYDWVYDQLTPANKADFSHTLESYWSMVNTYGYQWVGSGYTSDNGCGNFPVGHMEGFGLAAIAFEGDDAITTDIFTNADHGITTRLNSRFFPATQTGCFASGYATESYNYGVGTLMRLELLFEAYRTAGKSALVGPGLFSGVLAWMQNITKATIYNSAPDTWSISSEGEWTATYTGVRYKILPYLTSALIGAGASEGGYALFYKNAINYANVPTGTPSTAYGFELSPFNAFLWKQPSAAPADYTGVYDPYWFGNGPGDYHSVARTDWTSSAIYTAFSGNTKPQTDHQVYDAGHVVIQRGSDRLLITAGYWKGTAGDCCDSVNLYAVKNWAENTIYATDTTSYFCSTNAGYIGCQVGASPINAPLAHKETANYVYSKLTLGKSYGTGGQPFVPYYRSFATVGGVSFVYDYLIAVHPTTSLRRQFWHTPGLSSGTPAGIASAITVAGNTASATVGSSTLWIKTLIPASPTITSVQNLGSSAGAWYTSGPARSTQHFEVSDPDQATNATTKYLTVLAPTASSVGAMPTMTSITGSGLVGALYDDGTPRAVVFSANGAALSGFSYTVTATGTVRHVVADLAVGSYAVTQDGGALTTVSAGVDGTITFTSTNGGTFAAGAPIVVPPTITTTTLNSGYIFVAYSPSTVLYTGDAGTCSVGSGFPAWASLNASTCVISGTPNAAAISNFTVTVTNLAGADSKALSINIAATPTPLAVSPLVATTPINAGVLLTASGGTSPYSWSAPGATVTSGTGLAFTATYATTGAKTVVLTDSASPTAGTLTVGVNVITHWPSATTSGRVSISGKARMQ
jgi:hypothetical protein